MKKAQFQIPGALVDFYAYVAAALVLAIFFGLFYIGQPSADKSKTVIESSSIGLDTGKILLNYVKTPVSKAGISMTLADAIILYQHDASFKPIIEEKSDSILKPLIKQCTHLCFNDKLFRQYGSCLDVLEFCEGDSILIPNFDGKEITITLDTNPTPKPRGRSR